METLVITHSHKDLIVWQKSIPSNIAEGRKRGGKKEYRQFLLIAVSSCVGLETQIELAKRLGFATNENCKIVDDLLLEVLKMLSQMIKMLTPNT